jgi:hypothetical protein
MYTLDAAETAALASFSQRLVDTLAAQYRAYVAAETATMRQMATDLEFLNLAVADKLGELRVVLA